MKLKLIFLSLFAVMNVYSQQISPISDDDYQNATFKNLDFLKNDLKDVRLIGLGEASHLMGETYTAKIKMVKYLHEQCGFDVLAFESPLYNLTKVNESLEKNTVSSEDMRRNIHYVWNPNEMIELYNYIIETRKTSHPLIYTGFDRSFFDSRCIGEIKKDYSNFIDSLKTHSKRDIVLDSVFYQKIEIVAHKSYGFSKRSPADTLYLHNKFKEITKVLDDIDYNQSTYFSYWKKITESLQSVYQEYYGASNRDRQMSKNIMFLADKKYPDKKIILWAATTHLLYNTEDIQGLSKIAFTQNQRPTGVYLKEKYKDKYYLLAFTPFQGKIGFKGYLGIGKHKIKSGEGSIEKHIDSKYKTNFAFVSLKSEAVRQELELNKITKSNLWGSEETNMTIKNIVDGLFYIKNEHVVTF